MSPLTETQRAVIADARMDMLRHSDNGFERVNAGVWHLCLTADVLHRRGLLTLQPDPHPGAQHQRVRPTQEGLNAIGKLTPAQIMALDVGAAYDGLIVATRSWSAEHSQAAKAVAGGDLAAYEAALGVPSELLLTSDGGGYARGQWCPCELYEDEWVRFERWSARGRTGHGFLHGACRRLLQSG